MPRYRYKAKDKEGNVYKGVMETADEPILLRTCAIRIFIAMNAQPGFRHGPASGR